MTFPFDPTQGLVIVEAKIAGPTNNVVVHLALDTGATNTFLDEALLAFAGYTPADATSQFNVLTASGTIRLLEVPVTSFMALGQTRTSFPIQAHSFPPGTGHDGVLGLLGLDFLRGHVLTIDFIKGEITLDPGTPAGPGVTP
ncbi:MAG TPA: retropepsin-like aspartic protease [Gemmataceae bacterium]|nr:retropepsin-like aspartic protease [Gemmataceae bacterium]